MTRKREELSQLLIKLMNNTKGDKNINLPTVNFPTQDGKLKPKSENNTDVKTAKPETESKRKASTSLETETHIVSFVTENTEQNNENKRKASASLETETRIVSFVTENTEQNNENKRKASTSLETETRIVSIVTENTEQNNEFNRTYQFIPLSISSNSTENNSTEMLAEQKPTRYT